MLCNRRIQAITHLVVSALSLGALLLAGTLGIGSMPPLGPALNPGTGVWTVASDASLPVTETLRVVGLDAATRIAFESNGTAHIAATSDHDLFVALGYLHAKFRLFQMDMLRRQGEGRLAEVVGAKALPSDEFEDQLNLVATAQTEWRTLSADDPARQVLLAYTQGVNASIEEDERTGHLPLMFKVLAYTPTRWTPLDTLVIQGVMTQTLDFTTGPLDYALLDKAFGYQRTMQWFPLVPINEQHAYDAGPYHQSRIQTSNASPAATNYTMNVSDADAAASLLTRLADLPPTAIHHGSNSNNWVIDGSKTATGKPLLAGDPHLEQTLPAIWYQVECRSPHYQFAGVGIPGIPVILIGRNQHISWSLTNTQNGATLYYREITDAAHPGQYFWRGAWHPIEAMRYTIRVKKAAPVTFTVLRTVHGPIMTQAGQTLAVWWVGALPSPNLDAMLRVLHADSFHLFRAALRDWLAPSQNFAYADDQGHIGLITAGYFPQVASGQPWLPLSGDGTSDVVGTIPFADLPQVYDPPSHFAFSANQRVVTADYPYYIGTSLDFFDVGYRASRIYHTLARGDNFTVVDMEQLQNDTHDSLASEIVPKVLATLQQHGLAGDEAQAAALLRNWDDNMDVHSAAATIWIQFWQRYIYDTFGPWWKAADVAQDQDGNLYLAADRASLVSRVLGEDLEAWTLTDPNNTGFTLPNGTSRSASDIMHRALTETVAALAKQLGHDARLWEWGRIHFREFPSLVQIPALGYGPFSAGGNPWTIDAADGGDVASAGPSWRFIMDWATPRGLGIYPGGASENPLSPWYRNQIPLWRRGAYYPILDASQAAVIANMPTWSLTP